MSILSSIEGKLKAKDGTEIYYVKDVPNDRKAVVVIVHGFAEHLGRYDYVKNKLNEFGYGVYRFDNRSHGKSGGERGHIEDYNNFIEDANLVVDMAKKENTDVPIFMLGHSMGGFITSSYGIRYGEKLDGQVLTDAATMKTPQVTGIKGPLFKLLSKIIPKKRIENPLSHLICHDRKVVKDYEEDPLNLNDATIKFFVEFMVNGVGWLNENMPSYSCPCLILHGGDDKIVDKRASENFYKTIASNDKEIKIYDGLYHEILNEDIKDDILEDIHKWLERHIS
ncbi:alpha/beta hydrolase [Dethiothermospora halolimnae]|uniref:alpha/beta hydrolase n=1 Tax=Dethiothermospora halolimnae TaxID=3114390 RepID=UPI003CCB9DD5